MAAAFTAGPVLGQSQIELDGREQVKADKLDARLNAFYQGLMKRYSPSNRAALQTAERSWIKYRDDNCKFESSGAEGGSIYPMIYSICLQGMTAERITHLKYQANCQEGDSSCVEPNE
jgi:uncharacterized protein YecT (DUF1311 family)